MNDYNYKNRRTRLLKVIGNNECLICGSRNNLQVHHVYNNGDMHSIGGRQGLKQLESDFYEFKAGNKSKEMIILCKQHHQALHYDNWEYEEISDLIERIGESRTKFIIAMVKK